MLKRAAKVAGSFTEPRRAAARRLAVFAALALASAGCVAQGAPARGGGGGAGAGAGAAARARAGADPGVGAGADAAAEQLFREAESLANRRRVIGVQLFVLDEAAEAGAAGERDAARRAALEAEAVRVLARTVAAYAALVDAPTLRAAKQRPPALLGLALTLQDSGDLRGAEARLRQLALEHPASREAPEAHLALANLAFAAGRLDEAVSACDGALDGAGAAGAALRKRALYLKAWSLRGLGGRDAVEEALEALRAIVQLGPARAGSLEATIDEAAERELVALYAAHGDLARARAFFAGAGERAGPRLLGEVEARAARRTRPEALDRPAL